MTARRIKLCPCGEPVVEYDPERCADHVHLSFSELWTHHERKFQVKLKTLQEKNFDKNTNFKPKFKPYAKDRKWQNRTKLAEDNKRVKRFIQTWIEEPEQRSQKTYLGLKIIEHEMWDSCAQRQAGGQPTRHREFMSGVLPPADILLAIISQMGIDRKGDPHSRGIEDLVGDRQCEHVNNWLLKNKQILFWRPMSESGRVRRRHTSDYEIS